MAFASLACVVVVSNHCCGKIDTLLNKLPFTFDSIKMKVNTQLSKVKLHFLISIFFCLIYTSSFWHPG